MELLNLIPHGRENAVKRAELQRLCGLTDRKMRNEIERLRADGHIICNMQDGKGYFRPTTKAEIRAQYKLNNARAMSVLVQQKFLKRGLDDERYENA